MPFMLIRSSWWYSFMATTVHVTCHASLQGLNLMISHAKSNEAVMDWMLFSCWILWKTNGLKKILVPKLMNPIPKIMLIHWCQVAVASADARPFRTGAMSAFAGLSCSWGKTQPTSLSYCCYYDNYPPIPMLFHGLSCSPIPSHALMLYSLSCFPM